MLPPAECDFISAVLSAHGINAVQLSGADFTYTKCFVWKGGLGFILEVLEGISCRAGRGNVGTTSGLFTGIATATESGIVAQTPLSQISERLRLPPLIPFPVGKLLPV